MREEDSRLDMDALQRLAEEFQPKLILAGWSAYPRQLDFPRFREIADSVGALLMVDMAHFAGLVAAGEHPSPVPHADVVTTTIHKTLGGARGGMILCKEEYAKKINSAVFPGQQGGPLMHVIAGKAVALKIAAVRAVPRAPAPHARGRRGAGRGAAERRASTCSPAAPTSTWCWWTCATPTSTASRPRTGSHEIGITVNRNAVPFDPRPPAVSSGLRVGTPALATRGFGVDDFREVGRVIAEALTGDFSDAAKAELSERTRALAERYPLYPQLAPAAV